MDFPYFSLGKILRPHFICDKACGKCKNTFTPIVFKSTESMSNKRKGEKMNNKKTHLYTII